MTELSNIEIERRIRALGGEGILTAQDILDFGKSTRQVAFLLLDGQWHNAAHIRDAAGNGMPASEGLRRMRSLREYMHVEARRIAENKRLWEYRVVKISRQELPTLETMFHFYSVAQVRAFLVASAVYMPHDRAISTLETTKSQLIEICGAGEKKLAWLAQQWCELRGHEPKFFMQALDEYCAICVDGESDSDPNDTQELKKT